MKIRNMYGNINPTFVKILVSRDWVQSFFFVVLVISELRSPDYIAIFKIWAFLAILKSIQSLKSQALNTFFNTLEPLWKLDLHCTQVSATSESLSYSKIAVAFWE